ncbi:uncharacterized protein IL334_006608 [Kwoniella shivajii]|uniref:Uncharacterized protein n=1 Tax=Kwoniella shivajii TaxID=564305 RepID=A0ABZ1D8I8_9TREE|nr:hypothetical protein IL334_006608 [Kwoniella shivajii]
MAPRVQTYRSGGSARSIVIVLFIVLVVYVFFFGNKRKKSSASAGDGDSSSDRARRHQQGGEDRFNPDNPNDDRRYSGDPKNDKRQKKDKKKKVEWEQPNTVPPLSAVPDHRTASPTRSAFRKRGPDDSLPPSPNTAKKNGIKWVDQEGKSPTEITKHFRKWNDFSSLTDESDKPYQHKEKKPEGPSKGVPNPIRWSASALSNKQNLSLPADLLKIMADIEKIASAKPGDQKLWGMALQDSWDDHLGSIPKVAVNIAAELAKHITRKDVNALSKKMKQRQKIGKTPGKPKRDKHRDFNAFTKNIGVDMNAPEFSYKLTLAWYLDTMRAKAYDTNMVIDDEFVPMTNDPETEKISHILGWMEYLGYLNKVQRLFVGLDLSGLAMRAQAMSENGGLRLDLTVFLPCDEDIEEPREYARRLLDSCGAFRMFHVDIVKSLDRTEHDVIDQDPFTRRRLIFRPGWTVKGVDSSKLSSPTPDHSIAQKMLITRDPIVIELPEKIRSKVPNRWIAAMGSSSFRKVLTRLSPGEIVFQKNRQYTWDKASLTPKNSTLSPAKFWLAWHMCGESLHRFKGKKGIDEQITSADYVRSLDLAGYVPLHMIKPHPTFLTIDGYPALEILVLAYIPLGQQGSTIELILNPKYGLRHELDRTKKPTRHLSQPVKLKLFISIANIQVKLQLQDDIDKFLTLSAGEGQGENVSDHIQHTLSNVFLVDQSTAGTAGEGKVPKGIKLNYVSPDQRGNASPTNDDGWHTPPVYETQPPVRPSATPPGGQGPFQPPPAPPSPGNPARPPGPGPQNSQGPFSIPPSPGRYPPLPPRAPAPTQQNGPQPGANTQRPETREEKAEREAHDRAKAAADVEVNETLNRQNNPVRSSGYQSPSVEEVPDEDLYKPQGRFGNLRESRNKPM